MLESQNTERSRPDWKKVPGYTAPLDLSGLFRKCSLDPELQNKASPAPGRFNGDSSYVNIFMAPGKALLQVLIKQGECGLWSCLISQPLLTLTPRCGLPTTHPRRLLGPLTSEPWLHLWITNVYFVLFLQRLCKGANVVGTIFQTWIKPLKAQPLFKSCYGNAGSCEGPDPRTARLPQHTRQSLKQKKVSSHEKESRLCISLHIKGNLQY